MSTTHRDTKPDTTAPAVRPFSIDVSDEALADLRRRVAATRWPDKEIVTDDSQGVQLKTIQQLAQALGEITTGARWRRD